MRETIYTKDLLQRYRKAALNNASSLLNEAKLLLENEHYARAYFLSVAAIEEVGKSTILYYAEGRNLNASDVQSRIRVDTQNHSTKITNAFVASLKSLDKQKFRESLTKILGYAGDLKRGREPAMYSDVGSDLTVKIPQNLVRSSAAKDCLRLAVACFEETQFMIESKVSPTTSPEQDKFWALGKKLTKYGKNKTSVNSCWITLKRMAFRRMLFLLSSQSITINIFPEGKNTNPKRSYIATSGLGVLLRF